VKKKGNKRGVNLIFWGKSKKTLRQLASEVNLKIWQIAMWSCQLGNADLTISTSELGYVNFAFCQCGVGKEEK
jgi:hypothetical protein